MTATSDSDVERSLDDPIWTIDGMMPIAVAHAEAAAKAAGIGVGEWLSALLARQLPAPDEAAGAPAHPGGDGAEAP